MTTWDTKAASGSGNLELDNGRGVGPSLPPEDHGVPGHGGGLFARPDSLKPIQGEDSTRAGTQGQALASPSCGRVGGS